MIKKFFAYDGAFMEILHKTGELIILSVVFLLCCVPVVTAGSSATSLYYAVMKSVRRERGNILQEFFSSMKRTFKKGCVISIAMTVWFVALFYSMHYFKSLGTENGDAVMILYLIIICLSAGITMYVFPVLSRFEMKLGAIWKLAFVMSIRYFYITLVLVAGDALIVWALIYAIPMPCILFVPGLWCFIITFMMEKVLLAYMPKPEEGDDAWYYADNKKQKSDKDEAERGRE